MSEARKRDAKNGSKEIVNKAQVVNALHRMNIQCV